MSCAAPAQAVLSATEPNGGAGRDQQTGAQCSCSYLNES